MYIGYYKKLGKANKNRQHFTMKQVLRYGTKEDKSEFSEMLCFISRQFIIIYAFMFTFP